MRVVRTLRRQKDVFHCRNPHWHKAVHFTGKNVASLSREDPCVWIFLGLLHRCSRLVRYREEVHKVLLVPIPTVCQLRITEGTTTRSETASTLTYTIQHTP